MISPTFGLTNLESCQKPRSREARRGSAGRHHDWSGVQFRRRRARSFGGEAVGLRGRGSGRRDLVDVIDESACRRRCRAGTGGGGKDTRGTRRALTPHAWMRRRGRPPPRGRGVRRAAREGIASRTRRPAALGGDDLVCAIAPPQARAAPATAATTGGGAGAAPSAGGGKLRGIAQAGDTTRARLHWQQEALGPRGSTRAAFVKQLQTVPHSQIGGRAIWRDFEA